LISTRFKNSQHQVDDQESYVKFVSEYVAEKLDRECRFFDPERIRDRPASLEQQVVDSLSPLRCLKIGRFDEVSSFDS
jgi:hypothetical protein